MQCITFVTVSPQFVPRMVCTSGQGHIVAAESQGICETRLSSQYTRQSARTERLIYDAAV